MTGRVAVVTAACAIVLAILAIQAATSRHADTYPPACGQTFACASTPPAP